MKKRILLFVVLLLCILWLGTTSYAGSQKLSNLEYNVTLNADGTADIVETWNIKITDTNTLFKTFELDSSKYGDITNVQVSEVTNTGVQSFVNSGKYAYHVDKGKFYALKRNNKEFEIAWGVSINDTQYKTYKISYRISNAIKNYNDCSEFYWQFVGKTNGIKADRVVGTVKLPYSVSTKENLRVWAHGPLEGTIHAISNDTVQFEVPRTSYRNNGRSKNCYNRKCIFFE